jgi:hypothetical protein
MKSQKFRQWSAEQTYDSLPDKLLQIHVRRLIGAGLVLTLVHGTVHTLHKQFDCMHVRTARNEFISFVDVTI